MVTYNYTPPNQLLLTEKVIRELIAPNLEFELLKYGRRDQCNCRVFHLSIKTKKSKKEKLDNYLSHQFVTNIESTKSGDLDSTSFEIRFKKIRRDFQQMYSSIFPAFSDYGDVNKYRRGKIGVLLFKRNENQHIEYAVVTETICSFSKENSKDIEAALLLSRKNITWKILGTGCECSSFPPIDIENLDKAKLTLLLKKLQSELNEDGDFVGEERGHYDYQH